MIPLTRTIASLGLTTLATVDASAAAKETVSPKKPNILFIISDDHAFQAISAYGHKLSDGSQLNRTPNIDSLAKDGAIFTQNFCANSICSPSRANILTGKHSHKNGVTKWQHFDGSQTTFPKLLKQAGYSTGIFGKWHLHTNPTGFDEWMVYPGQGHYYNPEYRTPEGKKTIEGYSVEVTTDLALDFIKRHKDKEEPFLAWCSYKAPHRTWMPGPKYLEMYKDRTFPIPPNFYDDFANRSSQPGKHKMGIDQHMHMGYDLKVPGIQGGWWGQVYDHGRMTPEQRKHWDAYYNPENEAFKAAKLSGKALAEWKYQRYIKDYLRCVAAVDDGVGRLLTYLKEQGLDENTIVVYTSDQGFYLGEHGWFDKRWMYEESFRMPLLMRWPGVIKAGKPVRQLTQNIDFAPTLLDAVGITPPAEMQGQSMMPLFKGQKVKWRDALYYQYYDHIGEHGVAAHYGVRTDRFKLIRFYKDNEWEMYDLKKDPSEMKSVYNDPAYADIREKLKKELLRLQDQYEITER